MPATASLIDHVMPVLALVPDERLKRALLDSFQGEAESIGRIEDCFSRLAGRRWSGEILSTIFNSWKATHLKMLAIYGLTCRLQRLAAAADGPDRLSLLLAASKNAETSHEDLGLDADGHTHAELYDQMTGAFVEDGWQLARYRLPAATAFSRWVYRNMVVEDIQVGLLTNLFSEIYNHGEYSTALPFFSEYADRFCDMEPLEKASALCYIDAHIENETEIGHFLVVLDALRLYLDATGEELDYDRAEATFRRYLRDLSSVMLGLTDLMAEES